MPPNDTISGRSLAVVLAMAMDIVSTWRCITLTAGKLALPGPPVNAGYRPGAASEPAGRISHNPRRPVL